MSTVVPFQRPQPQETVLKEKRLSEQAHQKRVRNMATNIQIAMNTVADRAKEMSDIEAAEIARQLYEIHNTALRVETLVAKFTPGDGNGNGGGRVA